MGSGETAPTMTKVHRALFERLGPGPVPAAMLDTPYGFQENADDIRARMVEYFRRFGRSPGRRGVVSLGERGPGRSPPTAVARIHEARYVMAGPGSPSYALRQWAGGPIPAALAEKLARGGILTMASAAALTLGIVTIPVYEIYKVGDDPAWLDGAGPARPGDRPQAAVVPHYDNAEGGNHDTRFCYIGERRLRVLEERLPAGAFVLGVDGHTALVLDLDDRRGDVSGLGAVTVRAAGRSTVFPSGTEDPIAALGAAASDAAAGRSIHAAAGWTGDPEMSPSRDDDPRWRRRSRTARTGPIGDAAAELEGAFVAALSAGDVRSAVNTVLELETAIGSRLRGGEHGPDLDAAAATFRSLVVRLGERRSAGVRDPRETLDPFVGDAARTTGPWGSRRTRLAGGGPIRDRLTEAGVDVRDEADGSHWLLRARLPELLQITYRGAYLGPAARYLCVTCGPGDSA